MNNTINYFMNPNTGIVDTLYSWMVDGDLESLIHVRLADGSEVPEDFKSCDSDRYDWVEVEVE